MTTPAHGHGDTYAAGPPHERYALGLDIGGSKIAAGLISIQGHVSLRQQVRTPAADGPVAVLSAAATAGRAVLQAARKARLTVAGAGVGAAGQIDHERGRVLYALATLPGWAGTAVRQGLEDALDLPVSVDNDVNAMALGETRFGAGRPFADVLYVAVGTGVGGAIVLDRRLRRGATWSAGELAHLMLDRDGVRLCNCGRPGHLEAYAAGPAIFERYVELSPGAGVNPAAGLREVAERARGGDALARQAIAEGACSLALGLNGLLCALDPQALIIGGGVAALGDLWWAPLEATLRANPMPGPASVALRAAALGADAALIGAACLMFDRMFDQKETAQP